MIRLFAFLWYKGQPNVTLFRPVPELFEVCVPDPPADAIDFGAFFQLGVQECGQQIRRKITRTDVNPGILVYLSPKKAAAVGSFLADDFGALNECSVVDHQRATLATDRVLSFVKALRT